MTQRGCREARSSVILGPLEVILVYECHWSGFPNAAGQTEHQTDASAAGPVALMDISTMTEVTAVVGGDWWARPGSLGAVPWGCVRPEELGRSNWTRVNCKRSWSWRLPCGRRERIYRSKGYRGLMIRYSRKSECETGRRAGVWRGERGNEMKDGIGDSLIVLCGGERVQQNARARHQDEEVGGFFLSLCGKREESGCS